MRRLLLKQLDQSRVRIRLFVSAPGQKPMIINGYIANSADLGDDDDTLQIDVHPIGRIDLEDEDRPTAIAAKPGDLFDRIARLNAKDKEGEP